VLHDIKEGLIDWTVGWVMQDNGEFTQHALYALWVIAFTESSFFPIPPDIPYIMMGVAKPEMALVLATILTTGSVLGGALGYAIGLYGGRPLVLWLANNRILGRMFTEKKFEMVEDLYRRYDVWAVLAAAFTPIPYKIFTIAGGLCRIPFWRFMLASLVGRAGRFYLVGVLLYFFGEQAQFLVKRFDLFLLAMLIMVVLGFVVVWWMRPKKADPAPPTVD